MVYLELCSAYASITWQKKINTLKQRKPIYMKSKFKYLSFILDIGIELNNQFTNFCSLQIC